MGAFMDKMNFVEWLEKAKKEQREDDDFDWDKSFEEWFLDYFDNYYDPKVNEMRLVRWLVLDVPEYERINGENRRWTRTVTSIFQFGDRFFSVDWEEGLTEMQECEFDYCTINEVKKVERTIVVTDWEIIKK